MSVPPEEPLPETEIATPPRGLPLPEEPAPAQVWGEARQPVSREVRRDARMRVVWVVALVIGLVGTGWIATDYFRELRPGTEPREPVPVAADGSATLAGITVSLVEAVDLGDAPSLGDSDWRPPAGFHAWRVVLETSSTNDDLLSCDAAIVDDRGRQFYANYFVDSFVEGYEWTYTCGVVEPEDDLGPRQSLLVLVPKDADVQTVRIWHSTLNPAYIEFEV